MQYLFYLTFLRCVAASWTALDGANSSGDVSLVIEPVLSREHGLSVVKEELETLNLTCSVFKNSSSLDTVYDMRWSTPNNSYNSKNRIMIQPSENTINLVILYLEQKDEGEYTCAAQPANRGGSLELLTQVVRVNVKSRRKVCGEAQFFCGYSKIQTCIHRRFKCDGHQDCQMGEDEDPALCGESPCMNKLPCEFTMAGSVVVRCIPKTWCCNFKEDANCTTREPLSCCPLSFQKSYPDERGYFSTHQPHFSDVTLLQTTVYTVIGCSIVFMIVVTVLVIAICRVHIKRSDVISRCPSHPPTRRLQSSSLYDLDIYFNGGCVLDSVNSPGYRITYNINNGVQIVGHAIDPPPYSEAICAPPKEGPPPPYTSREAVNQQETEALLQPALGPQSNTQVGEGSQPTASVLLLPQSEDRSSH